VRDVPAHRHPVPGVLGEEVEPLVVAALVEEVDFAVEELLDLGLQEEPRDVGYQSSAQEDASMNWRQRV
jgi:hypothetical protein